MTDRRVSVDDFNDIPDMTIGADLTGVDLDAVLGFTEGFVRRFVVLTDEQAGAVALWVAHTHGFDGAHATAYLSITSAEKRSGKTRLLEALELVVAKPWLTGRTTAAALVRKIAAAQPTLLLDESDAAFNGDKEYAEALRGILNSGHRLGGCASLCVGQGANIEVRDFPVFSPKAIAGIGQLPDTVADRSIPARLKRRAPDEEVERFRRRDAEFVAAPVRDALAAWAKTAIESLRIARPVIPDELDDRAADGWESLFAIADLAGGEWPERARAAALSLSAGETREDESLGVRLLADVRRVFDERSSDRLATTALIEGLAADEEAPWSDWRGKGPVRPKTLARFLQGFGIKSRTVRLAPEQTARGYLRESFEDAWQRYLPSFPGDFPDTTTQPASLSQKHAIPKRHATPLVSLEKQAANPHEQMVVSAVSLENRDNGHRTVPGAGDEDFLDYLAGVHADGRITTAEALERQKTHAAIVRAEDAT